MFEKTKHKTLLGYIYSVNVGVRLKAKLHKRVRKLLTGLDEYENILISVDNVCFALVKPSAFKLHIFKDFQRTVYDYEMCKLILFL